MVARLVWDQVVRVRVSAPRHKKCCVFDIDNIRKFL